MGLLGWIVVLTLATVLWGSRAHWTRKMCPQCRRWIPALATRCAHCQQPQAPPTLAA